MPIPIEQEDLASLKAWGLGLEKLSERCVLCSAPTQTWHRPTNQPVCSGCAHVRDVTDLPRKQRQVA